MTPVAIRSSQRGQISIFFSASIVVLISIVAFVINIGLFVKAKINLQNATDAAAFSGAAVQARHLSKIAYMNWEMRNIYKEWMYKYYVVGNLNITDVETPGTSGAMSFRLQADNNVITGVREEDPYNIPAVCIHLTQSKTNICKRYAIPGLPEFGSSNLPGAEEASRAFMDVLISSKVNDCIDRTRLNMLVATTWAYNVLTSDVDDVLVKQGPAILSNRQGAWPRAIEVAMRMRNLEKAMNREAETSGLCENVGSIPSCTKDIRTISQDKKMGSERIVKAFYSGLRNLGNEDDAEMKDSFTLTEIPPTKVPVAGSQNSASYLLVPRDQVQNYEKQYIDLKLMMVNLAVFYAAMIPRADSATSGACDVSKVAIPVPGYPLGFYKNPDVLTYYAVRGEALFSGMFNPFDTEDIKLTAYAAAKPFGGRVGPMLFVQRPGQSFFLGRQDSNKFRSIPYISTLDLSQMPKRNNQPGVIGNGVFIPGLPLPINFDQPDPGYFWIKDASTPLGGDAQNGDVQFGIPNMVYEYQTPFRTAGYTLGAGRINTITPNKQITGDQPVGLYSKFQFNLFKGTALTNDVSQETLENEIARVRAPTLYESANYLIPSNNKLNLDLELDSFGSINGPPQRKGAVNVHTTMFYAPLFNPGQEDVLWKNQDDVIRTIFEFMRGQGSAVRKYKSSLNFAAKAIYDMRNNVAAEAAGSIPGYEKAARGVSDILFTGPAAANIGTQQPQSCASLAGQFLHFYYGDTDIGSGQQVANLAGCPQTLGAMLKKYFNPSLGNAGYDRDHYRFEYSSYPQNFARAPARGLSLFSAYVPGPFTGVGNDGIFDNAVQGSDIRENMRRNFYSTKLIPLDSLQKSRPGFDENLTGFPVMSEGTVIRQSGTETSQSDFKNPLDAASIGIDLSGVTY